jgi:hypothetical protein
MAFLVMISILSFQNDKIHTRLGDRPVANPPHWVDIFILKSVAFCTDSPAVAELRHSSFQESGLLQYHSAAWADTLNFQPLAGYRKRRPLAP